MAFLGPLDSPTWFTPPADNSDLVATGTIPPAHPNHVVSGNYSPTPNDAADLINEAQSDPFSVSSHDATSLDHSTPTDPPSNVSATDYREDYDNAIQGFLNGNLYQHFPEDDGEADSGDAADMDNYDEGSFSDGDNDYDAQSDACSNSSDHSAEAEIKYNLRLAPRLAANNAFNSTWIDNDQSGDYDPSSVGIDVHRLLQSQHRHKRFLRDTSGNDDDVEDQDNTRKRSKSMSSNLRRQHGDHLIVTLKINSPMGKQLLQGQTDNWPLEDSWNIFDDDISGPDNGHWYRLRNRCKAGLVQDYTRYANHPEARGCTSCLDMGLRCSLLDPESSYPCDDCIGEAYDCELVMPSKFKRACENCKSRRKQCSYTKGGDHGEPCTGCQEQEWRCVAGPAIDPTRVRIGHDGSPVSLYGGGKRLSTSCTACKQSRKSCSIKSGDVPPCANCKIEGEDCHFGRAKRRRSPPKRKALKERPITRRPSRAEVLPSRSIPEQVAIKDLAHRPMKNMPQLRASDRPRLMPHKEGTIKLIKTKLAHPITFNAVQTKDKPCHWCTIPILGLLGLGLRRVKVLEWRNGKGYTELEGGHTNDGLEPCRMCADCTLQRIFIALCSRHVMKLIPNRMPSSIDVNVLATQLRNCHTPTEVHETCDQFCSLCPSVAATECCTDHDTSMFEENRKPKTGCGLRLCETCQILFDQVYEHNLQVMLDQITVDPNWYPHGLRPDSDFFKSNSQMLKQIGC